MRTLFGASEKRGPRAGGAGAGGAGPRAEARAAREGGPPGPWARGEREGDARRKTTNTTTSVLA